MKIKSCITALCLVLLLSLQSCAVAGGIFKAGTAAGVILVFLIIAVVLFVIFRLFRNKN